MPRFHETIGGQQFFNGTVKNLIGVLERCADALEERNRLHEEQRTNLIEDLKKLESKGQLDDFKKFIIDTALRDAEKLVPEQTPFIAPEEPDVSKET